LLTATRLSALLSATLLTATLQIKLSIFCISLHFVISSIKF